MAEVKWIKITTDMFDNRKIRHLRRLPEGNNIVLLWVMLLTMAGRCNASGMIFLTENIPYTAKMLADELGFEENTVQMGLAVMEQLNMISTNKEGFYSISGWEEYQSTDRLSEIREYNRIAKQKSRAKQKALPDVNDKSMTSQRGHDTDIDIDIDKEIDKEKKSNKGRSRFTPPSLEEVAAYCKERGDKVDPERFIDYYTSNGWKVGKNAMKDWKAAVRTWERSESGGKAAGDSKPSQQYGTYL